MTGRISPGALILTWLFYAYQRWRFDDMRPGSPTQKVLTVCTNS